MPKTSPTRDEWLSNEHGHFGREAIGSCFEWIQVKDLTFDRDVRSIRRRKTALSVWSNRGILNCERQYHGFVASPAWCPQTQICGSRLSILHPELRATKFDSSLTAACSHIHPQQFQPYQTLHHSRLILSFRVGNKKSTPYLGLDLWSPFPAAHMSCKARACKPKLQ
jgi:hypothetical protein